MIAEYDNTENPACEKIIIGYVELDESTGAFSNE